jgi:hypothetical protein
MREVYVVNLDHEQIAVLRVLYELEVPISWTEIDRTAWPIEDKRKFIEHADGLSALGLVNIINSEGNSPHYQLNSAGIKVAEALIEIQRSQKTS